MLIAGLLTSDMMATIFLNVDELIRENSTFAEMLRTAVNKSVESGDDDLTTEKVGAIFIESLGMLRAFESYCIRQVRVCAIFLHGLLTLI